MGRKRVARVRGEGKATLTDAPDAPGRQADEEVAKLNVYKVDSHIVHVRDGHAVARPGSHRSQLVAAESIEAAIAGAAEARGEGFEVAHVSNAYQGVLIVLPDEKAPSEKR